MHPTPLNPGWTPLHPGMQGQKRGCWYMGCSEWAELASVGSTGMAQNCLASLPCVQSHFPNSGKTSEVLAAGCWHTGADASSVPLSGPCYQTGAE